MFRVPNDFVNPTFDDTRKISFWKWLTSNAYQRHIWRSLRDHATKTAQQNQQDEAVAWAAQKIEERRNAHYRNV